VNLFALIQLPEQQMVYMILDDLGFLTFFCFKFTYIH
jgi:hypothetical protein